MLLQLSLLPCFALGMLPILPSPGGGGGGRGGGYVPPDSEILLKSNKLKLKKGNCGTRWRGLFDNPTCAGDCEDYELLIFPEYSRDPNGRWATKVDERGAFMDYRMNDWGAHRIRGGMTVTEAGRTMPANVYAVDWNHASQYNNELMGMMSLYRQSGGAYMVNLECRSGLGVDGLACGCYAGQYTYESWKIDDGQYCWRSRCMNGEARLRRLVVPGTGTEECEKPSITSKFQCQQVGCCQWENGSCRSNVGFEDKECTRPQAPADLPERPKAEEICEKDGWTEGVCNMLGCCQWESESGKCRAAHTGQCEPTGQDICEGHGFSEKFCSHNPCCKWSQGECKSAGDYCHDHPTSWSPENVRDFLFPADKYHIKKRVVTRE